MLDEMKEPLDEKNIKLSYDEKALKAIAKKSHSKHLGARDIRRVIRNDIEDKIASILIDSDDKIGAVAISADDEGEITVSSL